MLSQQDNSSVDDDNSDDVAREPAPCLVTDELWKELRGLIPPLLLNELNSVLLYVVHALTGLWEDVLGDVVTATPEQISRLTHNETNTNTNINTNTNPTNTNPTNTNPTNTTPSPHSSHSPDSTPQDQPQNQQQNQQQQNQQQQQQNQQQQTNPLPPLVTAAMRWCEMRKACTQQHYITLAQFLADILATLHPFADNGAIPTPHNNSNNNNTNNTNNNTNTNNTNNNNSLSSLSSTRQHPRGVISLLLHTLRAVLASVLPRINDIISRISSCVETATTKEPSTDQNSRNSNLRKAALHEPTRQWVMECVTSLGRGGAVSVLPHVSLNVLGMRLFFLPSAFCGVAVEESESVLVETGLFKSRASVLQRMLRPHDVEMLLCWRELEDRREWKVKLTGRRAEVYVSEDVLGDVSKYEGYELAKSLRMNRGRPKKRARSPQQQTTTTEQRNTKPRSESSHPLNVDENIPEW